MAVNDDTFNANTLYVMLGYVMYSIPYIASANMYYSKPNTDSIQMIYFTTYSLFERLFYYKHNITNNNILT